MSMRWVSIHDKVLPPCWKLIGLGMETRGVSEIGINRLDRGSFVPQFNQPSWGLRVATTGINDQIGVKCSGKTPLSSLGYLDANDTRPVLRGEQSCHFSISNDMYFGPL